MTNTQIAVISFLLCLVVLVACVMLKSQNHPSKSKSQKAKETDNIICNKKSAPNAKLEN